jgi:hypothetical protein
MEPHEKPITQDYEPAVAVIQEPKDFLMFGCVLAVTAPLCKEVRSMDPWAKDTIPLSRKAMAIM